jgi:hypothetical protein
VGDRHDDRVAVGASSIGIPIDAGITTTNTKTISAFWDAPDLLGKYPVVGRQSDHAEQLIVARRPILRGRSSERGRA